MFNPKQFELISAGDFESPPLDPLTLQADAVRARFQAQTTWLPELTGDRVRPPGTVLTPAAVLIPLLQDPLGNLEVLLTRRTDKLKKHAGQIAFPGGKLDPQDVNAQAAAVREAWEEVGLGAQYVEVLGILNQYETGTGFLITPVVAIVPQNLQFRANEQEVAEIFTVPLAFLMNPANHQRRRFMWENGPREFFAMPYQKADTEYFIWGASAAILRNLYRYLSVRLA